MLRRYDVLSLRGQRQESIAYGSHATVECRHTMRIGECFHAVFKIGYRGIARARIVRSARTAGKSLGHGCGIVKLIGHSMVYRHAQSIINIAARIGQMQRLSSLSLHLSLFLFALRFLFF